MKPENLRTVFQAAENSDIDFLRMNLRKDNGPFKL